MTSKLERYLAKELYSRFGGLSIRQNYRPDWMEGLELDFYIEELKIAAEVQGAQHYNFVEFFHRTENGFNEQLKRDAKKSVICREKKITLIEIFTEKDADLFVSKIKELDIKRIPKYYYQDVEEKKTSGKRLSKNINKQRMAMHMMEKALKKKFKKATHINAKLDIAVKAIKSSLIHKVDIPEEIKMFIKQNEQEVNKRVGVNQ